VQNLQQNKRYLRALLYKIIFRTANFVVLFFVFSVIFYEKIKKIIFFAFFFGYLHILYIFSIYSSCRYPALTTIERKSLPPPLMEVAEVIINMHFRNVLICSNLTIAYVDFF